MIKRYPTAYAVQQDLGHLATDGRCMQCERPDVKVYPYLSLKLCAPCIAAAGSRD
jgi:hypothetical protein